MQGEVEQNGDTQRQIVGVGDAAAEQTLPDARDALHGRKPRGGGGGGGGGGALVVVHDVAVVADRVVVEVLENVTDVAPGWQLLKGGVAELEPLALGEPGFLQRPDGAAANST